MLAGSGFAGPRHCGGQAMTEMVVVSIFFLVPFFLFIVLIGKYVDMRSSTLQAARYAAFERTVYSATGNEREATMAKLTDAQLANGTRMRFFSSGVDSIVQTQNDSTSAYAGNPLWSDQGGNLLLSNADSAGGTGGTTVAANAAGEPASFAADVVLQNTLGTWQSTVGSVLGDLGGFALTYEKYYTASVAATPSNPIGPAPFDSINLTFNASDTLLADGWSASDIDYEKAQAQRMVPTGVLNFLNNTVVDAIGGAVVPDLFGSPLGPQQGPQFGYVVVDTAGSVPADRLANYTPPAPSGGGNPDISGQVSQTITQYENLGFSLVSQVTNADGSVTLTFSKDGATVTQTVGGSGGSGSNNTLPPQNGTVYSVTNSTIANLEAGGYTLTSGPTFTCAGGCIGSPVDYTPATSATATLTQSFTSNGHTFTSTMTVAVTQASPYNPLNPQAIVQENSQ